MFESGGARRAEVDQQLLMQLYKDTPGYCLRRYQVGKHYFRFCVDNQWKEWTITIMKISLEGIVLKMKSSGAEKIGPVLVPYCTKFNLSKDQPLFVNIGYEKTISGVIVALIGYQDFSDI